MHAHCAGSSLARLVLYDDEDLTSVAVEPCSPTLAVQQGVSASFVLFALTQHRWLQHDRPSIRLRSTSCQIMATLNMYDGSHQHVLINHMSVMTANLQLRTIPLQLRCMQVSSINAHCTVILKLSRLCPDPDIYRAGAAGPEENASRVSVGGMVCGRALLTSR